MGLTRPFSGLDRRTAALRGTLLMATLAGMLLSMPLWSNSRTFPPLPIVPGFPLLTSPWDTIFFGAMLSSLVMAARFYRMAVGFFLVASVFAFLQDQNRGQPWFYMYWVMLLLSTLPAPQAIAACRCALSAAYLWSGIQKLNPNFFNGVPGWFVAPMSEWNLPAAIMDLTRWLITAAPFLEIGIGIALWLPRIRRVTLIIAITLHAGTLLLIGPLGHNHNVIVWPWNVAMMALVWMLFARFPDDKAVPNNFISFRRALGDLRHSKLSMTTLFLFSFLPILSYSGRWDSAFSFTLYAETQAGANIFVTQEFADRLPSSLQKHIEPYPQFDPQFQNPFLFMYGKWCYEELRVPIAPEPRNFLAVYQFLRTYAEKPQDVRLLIGTRSGPVRFYEGDNLLLLERKK